MKSYIKYTSFIFISLITIGCMPTKQALEKISGIPSASISKREVTVLRNYKIFTEEDSRKFVTLPEAGHCNLNTASYSDLSTPIYSKSNITKHGDDLELELEFLNNFNSNSDTYEEICEYQVETADRIENRKVSYKFIAVPDNNNIDAPNVPDLNISLTTTNAGTKWMLTNDFRDDNDDDLVYNIQIINAPQRGITESFNYSNELILEYTLTDDSSSSDSFSFTMEDQHGNLSREIFVEINIPTNN